VRVTILCIGVVAGVDVSDDLHFVSSEVMRLASSRAVRRKQNLMVLDGPRLISRALLCDIKPNAVYFSRLRDIDSELSDAVVDSGVKLYQLTSQQAKLARDQGIVSSLFGNWFFSIVSAVCSSFLDHPVH